MQTKMYENMNMESDEEVTGRISNNIRRTEF